MYATGVLSDLTVFGGGREFQVHSTVLFAQSSFFYKLFNSKFKVRRCEVAPPTLMANVTQESSERPSTLELDDDPEVLASLIHYFYNNTYDDSSRGEHQAVQTFTVHVYAIADKYDVPQLQQLAAQKFGKVCAPVSDIDDFIAALCAVDGATNPADNTLWKVVLPIIEKNISYLLQHEQFKAVVDSIPELKWGLLALLDPSRPRELTLPAPSTSSTVSIPGFEHEGDDEDEAEMRPFSDWRGPGRRLG